MLRSIYIGFEPREAVAFWVATHSIRNRLSVRIPIRGLELTALRERGFYTRPTEVRDGRLYDVISEHAMSTEFAISRFLVPHLTRLAAGATRRHAVDAGWALFADCDVLALADISTVFTLADPRYAVMCVKHAHVPASETKMDNQVQSVYPRKNWSSVVLFNCDHPSNINKLTIPFINTVPGRDLHAFSWLDDSEIGELPVDYNVLVGHTLCKCPKLLHFTSGGPWHDEHKDVPFAEDWRSELRGASHTIVV